MLRQTTVRLRVGDGEIRANVFQNGAASPTLLSVHDDEDTAVAAGQANLAQFGGRLIELAHTGDRLVTFTLDGQPYTFDPNRIFSDTGIAGTLRKEGRYSPAAHAAIRQFAATYLETFALDREPVIIALHNGTDGAFSVASFLPGAEHGTNAAAAHINRDRSPSDFYFTTHRGFFDALSRRGFNAVLQDNERAAEDGSLSVYFARKGIPYINVEADAGHLHQQVEMLAAVREMLLAAR